MGIPPAISLLLVSDTAAYREAVTDAVEHHPDISLTTTVSPHVTDADAVASADCVLIDAATDGLSLPDIRATLRARYPTLPVIVATAESMTLSPSLSVHARVDRADPLVIPELARVITTLGRRHTSPSVSAEHR